MKVLVSGGAGFLGSHLCDALIKKGCEVICIDNLITGTKNNISHLLKNPNFTFINHDIVQSFLKAVDRQLSAVSQIYHLASPASPKDYFSHPLETMLTNSEGTLNLLKLAKANKAKFLFASTSEVYGDPLEHPQKESYHGNVNPLTLRAAYDESKRFGEALTMLFIKKYDLDGRIARIFNTYGPRMRIGDGRPIPTFITQALKGQPLTVHGTGLQTRSFCFVSDLIEGIILAMEKKGTRGGVFNLGNPDERSIIEIAKIIKKLVRKDAKIVYVERYPNDPERRCPDITKAKNILHWEPKVSLRNGLKKTIDYFKELTK